MRRRQPSALLWLLLSLAVAATGCSLSSTTTMSIEPSASAAPTNTPSTSTVDPTPTPTSNAEPAREAVQSPSSNPPLTPEPTSEAALVIEGSVELPPAAIGFEALQEATASPQPIAMRIESLDIGNADVIAVGVNQQDLSFEVPPADQVGWYEFGPTPGAAGSAVLAAHIAYNGVDGVFRNLSKVQIGAIVEVDFDDGSSQRYRIEEVTEYLKEELPDSLFARTGDPQLALITCGGSFNRQLSSYESNTVAIAVAKFIGFFITRSSSMLAEAIHSVADSGNQALLLWGGKAARKKADEEHQFGYGRERYYWAFVVALVLFLVGSGFALYEGVEKIRHPHEIDNPNVAYAILGFAILAEAYAFRTAVVASKPLKGDQTWWEFIRTTRVPELAVVLLEDFGAMLGLLIAMASVWISVTFDAPVWDGIGTLTIGILLLVIAMILIIEMRSLLLGEGATETDMNKIRETINGTPKVKQLLHLRTQHLGPEELLVGAKVEFDPGLSTAELAAAIDDVEAAVRSVVPHARPMYIEADLHKEFPAGEDH